MNKTTLANKIYEPILKQKKVYFNPHIRTKEEQDKHIYSLYVKKMKAREQLLDKYEEMAPSEPEYTFQPEISRESRLIARRLREDSVESLESVEGFFNSKYLLTHQRASLDRLSRRSSKELRITKREDSQRVIYRLDGSMVEPGRKRSKRGLSIPINDMTMATFERNMRREHSQTMRSPYTCRDDVENKRLILSRRDKRKDKALTQRILRSRSRKKSRSKSRSRNNSKFTNNKMSGAITARSKSMARLVQKIHIPDPSPNNKNPTSRRTRSRSKPALSRSNLSNSSFISKRSKSKKRVSRRPFDPVKSGNRMYSRAREYQQKKQIARMGVTDGFFQPRINHTKEVCKQNVRRLIDVLDMRLNRSKMVESSENLNWVNFNENRILESKVPYELRRNKKNFF